MREKIKLFCIPYAGGSTEVFNKWRKHLHTSIDLVPVELAGRGRRMQEPLYKDMAEAIRDVYKTVEKQIGNDTRYAIFGHSMGCKIAYELAQKIKSDKLNQPRHIFFSGRSAPHLKNERKKQYHLMNDEQFMQEIIDLGGTPREVFEHKELLDVFLPLLKNDFRIVETDHVTENPVDPLHNDISVFLGKKDELTHGDLSAWQMHTTRGCRIHYFEGGHFFLNESTEQLISLINATLVVN